MSALRRRFTGWLGEAPPWVLAVFAVVMAFATYFCMYAFRKPYTASSYEGFEFAGLRLKDAFVISQVAGYAISKFIGIKFNSEMPAAKRLLALVSLILAAEAALLLFGVLPTDLKFIALFLNGLPLGAVWGLVFSFLEGRQTSEFLGAGLSCSYIVASGYVKTAAEQIMDSGVDQFWMPVVTGLAFLPAFLVFAYGLSLIPPPSKADEVARTVRAPMDGRARRAFFGRFAGGLVLLIIIYFFLTAYRSFRDDFAKELWIDLGYSGDPSIFTETELYVAAGVMAVLALLFLVKDNRLGLLLTYIIMTAGTVLIGVATLLFDSGAITGFTWMVLVGLGAYLAYVPYGCVLFDRMIAALGVVATAVFLIYVSDAFGYGGTVALVLYKKLGEPNLSFLDFFRSFSYVVSVVSTVFFVISGLYFMRRTRPSAIGADAG